MSQADEVSVESGAGSGVLVKMICYVCGSEDLSTEKCKVWCRKCHALIENCSGD